MPTRDLAARFRHQPPRHDADVRAHERVRAALSQAAHVLDALVPDGREKSTALTKIEEAMMWANAGIARGGTATDPKPRPGDGGPIPASRREDDELVRVPYTDGAATRIVEHERSLKELVQEQERGLLAAEQLKDRGLPADVRTYLNMPAEELAAELAKNNGLAVIGTKEPAA